MAIYKSVHVDDSSVIVPHKVDWLKTENKLIGNVSSASAVPQNHFKRYKKKSGIGRSI